MSLKLPLNLSVPMGLEPPMDYELFGGGGDDWNGMEGGGVKSKMEKDLIFDDDLLNSITPDLCSNDSGLCDELVYENLIAIMSEPSISETYLNSDELMEAIRDEFDNAKSDYQLTLNNKSTASSKKITKTTRVQHKNKEKSNKRRTRKNKKVIDK